jgi:hypothetical protein
MLNRSATVRDRAKPIPNAFNTESLIKPPGQFVLGTPK